MINSNEGYAYPIWNKMLLFVFIFVIFFFRTNEVFGYHISTLFFAFLALLLLYMGFINIKSWKVSYERVSYFHLLFCVFILLGLVWNLVFYTTYFRHTFLLFAEIVFNLMAFYYCFAMTAKNPAFIHTFSKILIVAAFIYPVPNMFFMLSKLDTVRRIGSVEAPIITAVNHIGQSFAIASFILLIYLIYKFVDSTEKKDWRLIIILIGLLGLTVGATILTGSRAGFFGLVISILLVVYFFFNTKKRLLIPVGLGLTIITIIVLNMPKYAQLVRRFSPTYLVDGIMSRVNIYLRIIEQFFGIEQLSVGAGWFRYEPYGLVSDFIHYPHNIILDFFLQTGFFTALLFLAVLVREWIFLLDFLIISKITQRIKKKAEDVKNAMLLFGVLNIAIAYSFSSGRLTRIIVIFCVLGLAAGFRKWISLNYKETSLCPENEPLPFEGREMPVE